MADLARWTLNHRIAASLLTLVAAVAMPHGATAADETCFKTPTPVMSLGIWQPL